jgi:hypothetical protein
MATLPTVQDVVNQNIALEPIGGPKDVFYYLNLFPEEIYQKSPDSHLYKFMRAMLGESGINWLRKNHMEARLLLEELGIDLFDLDKFYGNIFGFGRILEESFDEDPFGVIPKDVWDQIKAKNSSYRNRALDFVNGARAGNTPFGMRLIAQSGLGHDVEIVENYKYLYDLHSDDPLGLPRFGKTTSTEEMIVLPRREIGESTENSVDELYEIGPKDQFYLRDAVDRIRPQTTLMTVASGRGMRQLTTWRSMYATSEYIQVIRYVTGTSKVQWPNTSETSWIVEQVEKESLRIAGDLQHNYTGFHNIISVSASSGTGSSALADYSEPLFITSSTEQDDGKMVSFINGIYPTEYRTLPGAPLIVYGDRQWTSSEGEDEEELIINFLSSKAVNFLTFDLYKEPLQIEVEYDAYDEDDQSLFVPVTPLAPYSNIITSATELENPWASVGLSFVNSQQDTVFTRSLKIRFIRLGTNTGPIQVKNLRAARSAA